ARAQPAPQLAATVHGDMAGAQVRRDTEVRCRQILDGRIFELALEQTADLASGRERDERQRVVVDRIRLDEAASHALDELAIVPFRCESCGDHRADARAADRIHFDAGFANGTEHAEMRKPARAAPGQYDAESVACDRASTWSA